VRELLVADGTGAGLVGLGVDCFGKEGAEPDADADPDAVASTEPDGVAEPASDGVPAGAVPSDDVEAVADVGVEDPAAERAA